MQLSHCIRLATVAIAAMLLAACSEESADAPADVIRPARTVVVSAGAAQLQRSYPAVVLPAQSADLSFRVSGRLVELPARAAMRVEEGDVIAQLDKRDFESTLAGLESQLEQADAQLAGMTAGARTEDQASLRAQVRSAQAQVSAQRNQVARILTLVDKGSIARAQLDQEQAKLVADQATLDEARQELAKGEAGSRTEEIEAQEAVIRGLGAQVARAANDLSDTTLRAPFDGIIASRSVDNFANVQANSVIAVVQKLSTIDLRFDVPASDVAKLAKRVDNVVIARLHSAPGSEYPVTISEFSTQADATTQTFRGRASMPYPEDADVTVLPGMTGSIIVTATLDGQPSIAVPASAIAAEADGSTFVWVVAAPANTVSKRTVKTRDIAGESVAVVDGLIEGDVVVTAGVSFLRENMTIRPIDADTAAGN